MPTFLKQVESMISSKQQDSTYVALTGEEIIYIKANRETLNEKWGNYFNSFNLPSSQDMMPSGSTTSLENPHLYQLNVNEIVIIPIGRDSYNDFVDGRSLTLTVPQTGGSGKTVVSTTYSMFDKKQDNILLGSNIAFLFSDDVNLPYSGTSADGAIDNSAHATWNPSSYLNRFPAAAYQDLESSDKNTDQRAWSTVNRVNSVPESYPNINDQGYNYDIPVGFVSLDRGFVVLTHPSIVDNIPWSSGTKVHLTGADDTPAGSVVVDGDNTSGLEQNIVFTASSYSTTVNPSASTLNFREISVDFKTGVLCLAAPGEFYLSTNPTWPQAANLQELENGTNNFDSIFVSQVGLYNVNQELIAVAKMSEPIEKKYTNIITFTLDIDV